MTTEETNGMMEVLKSNPGLTCRDIGKRIGVSWQKANAILGKLERDRRAMFMACGSPSSIIWFCREAE